MVSIILCCFNGEQYVSKAISSVLMQQHTDLELIFVNDGSTDSSLSIAETYVEKDNRIKVISQSNKGLNAARNFGAGFISEQSKALLFFDADDIMDETMIYKLNKELQSSNDIGAVYCDFKTIDEEGKEVYNNINNNRIVPCGNWFKELSADKKITPLFSIYAWTIMAEAFTLMRKDLYFKYGGWDEINFPKGDTFGESIPLFSQIALNHKIIFVNEKLYHYRKHKDQITSQKVDMQKVQKKIDRIILEKLVLQEEAKQKINKVINLNKFRLPLYKYIKSSMRHELRFTPVKGVLNLSKKSIYYLYSLVR